MSDGGVHAPAPAAEAGGAKAWVLAFVVAAGLGMGALIGVGCAIGANACPFATHEPVTTTDGAVLYASFCAACHGRGGEGSSRAPSLATGKAASLSMPMLIEKIRRGRPFAGMPRFEGTLSPPQIDAVAGHVAGLRGTK